MQALTIERVYLDHATLGSLYLGATNRFRLCKSFELPWKENRRSISCIPEDTYLMKREATSPKHPYPHFRIPKVPGRSGILIHRGKFVRHTKGCIFVGSAFQDIDEDGSLDITDSILVLQALYDSLEDECEITFKKKLNAI